MTRWPRPLVAGLDLLNRRGKGLSVRLVKYTGKSPHFIHPKHLVETPGHDWYLAHLSPGDVALDVGYLDSAHFSRSIRRCYGLTPSDIAAGSRGLP